MHDLRSLQAFRSTAVEGSVRGAAARLRTAPSAVSAQIRSLEKRLGLELFARSGRRLELTPSGRELLAAAEGVFAALGALDQRAAELREDRSDRLVIGYFSSAGVPWMPDLISYLEHRHPGVSVTLELTAGEISEDGQDVQLVVAAEEEITVPASMGAELLVIDPFVAAVPHSHPLARRESVGLDELTELAWIDNDDLAGSDGTCRRVFIDACRSAGVDLAFRHQAHDHRTALEMVERGLGATVLPALGVRDPGAGTAVLPITDPELRRVIHVVWRREGPDPVVVADARRALHDLAADGFVARA